MTEQLIDKVKKSFLGTMIYLLNETREDHELLVTVDGKEYSLVIDADGDELVLTVLDDLDENDVEIAKFVVDITPFQCDLHSPPGSWIVCTGQLSPSLHTSTVEEGCLNGLTEAVARTSNSSTMSKA